MATTAQIDELREQLGEVEDDSLIDESRLAQLIDTNPSMGLAVVAGWRIKAAKLANLVDTTEGNAQRKYSQLLDNALKMVSMNSGRASTSITQGRTRIGRIRRTESDAPPWAR